MTSALLSKDANRKVVRSSGKINIRTLAPLSRVPSDEGQLGSALLVADRCSIIRSTPAIEKFCQDAESSRELAAFPPKPHRKCDIIEIM